MATKKKTPQKLITASDRRTFNKKMREGSPDEAYTFLKDTARARSALFAASNIDATQSTSKRRTPKHTVCSLDGEFGSQRTRDTMVATARDLTLNFSLARGLKQTHVNNVVGTGPRLQMQTDDQDFNDRVEEAFVRWGKTCDVRGVLNWGRFIRMSEGSTVVDGDCGIILRRGLKLQGVEGDRIANPPDVSQTSAEWVYGVKVDKDLRATGYSVYKRGNSNSRQGRRKEDWAKTVPAKNFVHSFDPERFDQVRGVSGFISAINDLQDTREAVEAVKGSIKLENIMSLIYKAKPTGDSGQNALGLLTDYEGARADTGASETRKEVKLNQGVNWFEIETDEEITSLDKRSPGAQFEPWVLFVIRMAAMALDMPLEVAFHYYSRGSFSSLKGAISDYHTAIRTRRERLEDQVCTRIATWVIFSMMKQRTLEEAASVPEKERRGLAPPKDGTDIRNFRWQWDQLPFLDPDEAIKADTEEYKMGATSLSDICAKRGKKWDQVQQQRIHEIVTITGMATDANIDPGEVLPQVKNPGEKTQTDNNQPPQSPASEDGDKL
ncbi:MAG TPA: phage portal protein [Pirellulales bacterium]|nr:phage portal protein [Pirellulales bacterium]